MKPIVDNKELPVRLKGIGDSLWVTLDPKQPTEFLLKHLEKVFRNLKEWTINARVVLDPGIQDGYDDLIKELGDFLKETFSVGVVSRPPKVKTEIVSNELKKENSSTGKDLSDDLLMIEGRVRSGQKIKAKKHLIVLGDVNPGAEITAGGDVLVMGSLRGTAVAGYPNNEDAIVLALDFDPTQIQIGGFVAAGLPPSERKVAEFAHVEKNKIVVENYLKTDPFGGLHIPQVRK